MLYIFRNIIRKLPGKVIKNVALAKNETISYSGACKEIGKLCDKYGFKRVLLITDKTLYSLGLHGGVIDSLKNHKISYSIFSNIASEPNLDIVKEGKEAFIKSNSEAIIALGGGAVMDSSKMIAAASKLKNKKIDSLLKKFLVVKNKTIPMITIPTTAGTGAEITVAAVITNKKSQKKCTVIHGLDIKATILDGNLTINTPKNITYACAIDALSHGLEGVVSDVKVDDNDFNKSMECVRLILDNLPILFKEPKNINARQNMCIAANYGGNAINKQLAGYVHAFAHAIGAKYHIPHGNAIMLSLLPIMNFQKNKCLAKLATLSRYCKISNSDDDLIATNSLLKAINDLIAACEFNYRDNFIKNDDLKSLIKAITLDSINYAPPMVFNNRQMRIILNEISNKHTRINDDKK